MPVKTDVVEEKKEQIIDDVSEHVVVSEPEIDGEKLMALKQKMAAKKEEPIDNTTKKKLLRSIKFGVIGSGQAGSRLSSFFYELGYDAIAINTASQDLEHINLPGSHKLLLEYGLGGASKDMEIGKAAAEAHKDKILQLVQSELGDSQMFIFCTSLGGGSGSGSADTVIDLLASFGKPIIVITILPMTSEDAQTKKNALEALSKLASKVKDKTIHNLIIADNAKIESIFSDVGQMDFYPVSNRAIVEPLDVFNTYSSKPSAIKGLDPMEFAKILVDGEGLSLYGCMNVYDYQEDTAIAEAVINNLSSGLLAGGFDLKQTKYVGAIVLANKEVWKKIPSASINYAMSMIQDHAGTPLGIFKGIYEADIAEDVVKVYSFFSGLALPAARVEELKKEVAIQKETIKTKDTTRNLQLNIDTGETDAVSAVEKIKNKIKMKSSTFGQFTQNVVDKRR